MKKNNILKEKLTSLKTKAITAIRSYNGDKLTTVITKDFGVCRAVNWDDAYLIIPPKAGVFLRSKKQINCEPGETYWDRHLSDMDLEEILDIADKLEEEKNSI